MDGGKQLVYIAGRYSADSRLDIERNIMVGKEASRKVLDLGYVPIVPHTAFDHLLGCADYDTLLEGCMALLSKCDKILMLPNWTHSPGARAELGFAIQHGIPVYYSLYDLENRNEGG